MAAQTQQPPLDEIQHRRVDIIDWWVNQMHYGPGPGIDENLLHRYISESPFFDHTTKNGLYIAQSRTNQHAFDLVRDRRRFEEQLSRQKGTEYVVVGDGKEGASNGVWVMRKQDRDRKARADGRGMEEELTTLGTYYVVGDAMYQAPSVSDVVGNRLLSAATNLSKFLDTASELPTFSPTAGYSYLPQSSSTKTTTASTNGTPTRSREGSVIPGADSQSLRSGSLGALDSQQTSSASLQHQDARLLASSFKQALEFGDEYMDENPITGEPGNFSFTSSLAAVKERKRQEAEKAAALKIKEESKSTATSPAKPPSPPAVMTEAKAVAKSEKDRDGRRGSKVEKIRRKKSRGVNTAGSPTTPVSAGGAMNAQGS